jgi:hypothetical protein
MGRSTRSPLALMGMSISVCNTTELSSAALCDWVSGNSLRAEGFVKELLGDSPTIAGRLRQGRVPGEACEL